MKVSNKQATPQTAPVSTTGPYLVPAKQKTVARQITMPLLRRNAPAAFEARGFSINRLRDAYKTGKWQAVELVLAGIILSLHERRAA